MIEVRDIISMYKVLLSQLQNLSRGDLVEVVKEVEEEVKRLRSEGVVTKAAREHAFLIWMAISEKLFCEYKETSVDPARLRFPIAVGTAMEIVHKLDKQEA